MQTDDKPNTPSAVALREPVAWIRPNWDDPATFDGMSPVSTYYTKGWLPLYLDTVLTAAPDTPDRLREALETLADVAEHAMRSEGGEGIWAVDEARKVLAALSSDDTSLVGGGDG